MINRSTHILSELSDNLTYANSSYAEFIVYLLCDRRIQSIFTLNAGYPAFREHLADSSRLRTAPTIMAGCLERNAVSIWASEVPAGQVVWSRGLVTWSGHVGWPGGLAGGRAQRGSICAMLNFSPPLCPTGIR